MNKYPKYYIENDENEPHVIWCLYEDGSVNIGMNDSPFSHSSLTADNLNNADNVRRITKREAKSLFPNLLKSI